MISAKSSAATPRLNIWPTVRIVASVLDATPYNRLSTEPMMALILGDEKRAKPKPSSTRQNLIQARGVASPSQTRRKRPVAQMAIPPEATTRGSILSDNHPARGEKTAWTTGCQIRTRPACCGVSSLMYCRYRLSKKPTAAVAL